MQSARLRGLVQALRHFTTAAAVDVRAAGTGQAAAQRAASSLDRTAALRALRALAVAVAGTAAVACAAAEGVHAEDPAPVDKDFDVAKELASMSSDARWLLFSQKGQEEARAGRLAEAERLFERACEEAEKSFPKIDPRVPASYNNLAEVCRRRRRYAAAQRAYERALALYSENDGRESNTTASVMFNLASLLLLRRQFGQAEALHREALAVRRVALHPDHPEIAQSLYQLALCAQAQGRPAEAEELVEESIRVVQARRGNTAPAVRLRLQKLGQLAAQRGDHAAALKAQQRLYVFETEEAGAGREDPSLFPVLVAIADSQRALGRLPEAEATYRRVLAAVERLAAVDKSDSARFGASAAVLRNRIASLLAVKGEAAAAAAEHGRAMAALAAQAGEASPMYARELADFAGALPAADADARREAWGRAAAAARRLSEALPRSDPLAAAEAVPVLRAAAEGCEKAGLRREAAALRSAAAAAERAAGVGADSASAEAVAASAAADARWRALQGGGRPWYRRLWPWG